MSRENPRLHGELLKLGIDVGQTSVAKYMVRVRKPLSQTWRTFLDNHPKTLVSVDFLTFPQSASRFSTCSRSSLTTGGG